MSGLFGRSTPAPQPQPVPIAPTAPDNTVALAARDDAAREAAIARASAGRASTIVGGMQIAQDAQQKKVLG